MGLTEASKEEVLQTDESHPEPELIERFLRAEASPAESRRVTLHLLRGCSECRDRARAAWYGTGSPIARLVSR